MHFTFLLHKVSLKLIYVLCVAICVRQTHELLHVYIYIYIYISSHRCHCYVTLPSSETNSNSVTFFVSESASNFTVCDSGFNPLNLELNPICYLLALLGAHHFLHVIRIRVKLLTFRLLISYIYGAPILDVSRSHATTQHSR